MSAHPLRDHHDATTSGAVSVARPVPYWAWHAFDMEWCHSHMVAKDECVYCQFGENSLLFMHACARCSEGDLGPKGIKTWGWRSPDGQELCIRCMALGMVQLLETHELVEPPAA
jgi:hypothetical protein